MLFARDASDIRFSAWPNNPLFSDQIVKFNKMVELTLKKKLKYGIINFETIILGLEYY